MNRSEHLQWCKDRALEYVDKGEFEEAVASMSSDMSKHPETSNPALIAMGMNMMMGGLLSTPEQVRKWINGFN